MFSIRYLNLIPFLFITLVCSANSSIRECSDLLLKIISKNERSNPILVWDLQGDLPTGISMLDYQHSAEDVMNLLGEIPSPSKVTIRLNASTQNQAEYRYDTMETIIELYTKLNRNAHPSYHLNTFQHELVHTYNNQFFLTSDAPLINDIRKNSFVRDELERLFKKTHEPNPNYKEIIAEMKALDILKPREELRRELLSGYDELLADLVTVIIQNDPRAMYKSIRASHLYNLMLESFGSSRRAIEFVDTYRRFDYHFGNARLQKWYDDLRFYMNGHNKFAFNGYLLFAPARSWLWEIFKEPASTNSSELPRMIKTLYETVFIQLKESIEKIEKNGVDSIDVIALNKELIETFKMRLN